MLTPAKEASILLFHLAIAASFLDPNSNFHRKRNAPQMAQTCRTCLPRIPPLWNFLSCVSRVSGANRYAAPLWVSGSTALWLLFPKLLENMQEFRLNDHRVAAEGSVQICIECQPTSVVNPENWKWQKAQFGLQEPDLMCDPLKQN